MEPGGAIYRFVTHDCGEPLTYGLVIDARESGAAQACAGLSALAQAANSHPDACAFGKIAVIAREGIFTFQVTGDNEALPVFCGNSTAAAILCIGGSETVVAVHGPAASPYRVSARIEEDRVRQDWSLPQGEIAERDWRGQPFVAIGALNEYAILRGNLPDGVSAETAQNELLGSAPTGKLAVVGENAGGRIVAFYNSNGRHGAVPQTGMASIALAARSVGWLDNCFPDKRLTYQTRSGPRTVQLPAIEAEGDGTVRFAMPAIAVTLSPMLEDLAA